MDPSAPPATRLPPARTVLAFDTSTEQLCAGLHTPAGQWLATVPGGAAASTQLLPQLQALLAQAGIGWAGVQAIAFGKGPGAFTGLRTACAVAQGLGLGLGLPLLPLDSLLLVAEDARLQALGDDPAAAHDDAPPLDVAVAMDARMDEAYAGCYRWQQGRWLTLQAPALYAADALPQAWAGLHPGAVAGTALTAFGPRVPWPDAPAYPHQTQRAAALLRLAVAAARHSPGVDAAEALPLYLRDKVAQTTDERLALRAAQAGPA